MAQGRTKKLIRGIVNTATGWIEIPKNIYDSTIENNLGTGLTTGITSGIGMAIVRTSCGVYEVVTFPFACPEGYQPILKPVYVVNIHKEETIQRGVDPSWSGPGPENR